MNPPSPTIIHTEASLGWGGQEIRILTECRWFREKNFQCVLMAPAGSPISDAFLAEGFEVIPVKFKKVSQLSDFWICFKVFRDRRPQLVGTHSNIDSRVALAAATCAKIARRVRYRHVSIPVRSSIWNRVIYRTFATKIITTAHVITSALSKDFSLPSGFATSIPTGVANTDLSDKDIARSTVRESLGISQASQIITQVSVLRAWKGHHYLLEAFDRLAADYQDLHLVLVGGGPGLEYLPAQIAGLSYWDRVHLVGHQEDTYPFFKAADIAVLASTGWEGVPQSTLQCFCCSTPFIGSDVGGIPDIVTSGENGLLVPPADSQQLARAMSALLQDPTLSATLASNARKTFDQIGSVDHMGQSIRAFLDL